MKKIAVTLLLLLIHSNICYGYTTVAMKDFEQELFEQDLERIKREYGSLERQWENNSSNRVTKNISQYAGMNLEATNVIIFFLLIGIIVSIIAVFIYNGFSNNSISTTQIQRNSNLKEPCQEETQEAEYIDAVFTDKTSNADFDYPYEDMKDALR